MKQLFVSVIIPARNEEEFIGRCLDSLIANDYPKNRLEILVVNGASTDKTAAIAAGYSEKYPFIKVLENPRITTPISMNIGVKSAKGDIVMIGGAHSTYNSDYISKSVRYLEKYGADNVGGALQTKPAVNTYPARAIALALSSFFGTGGASFRVGGKKPTWTDTAFGGCFRKEVFGKIGYFNESLTRSQDMEFSIRLHRAGGKILFAPDISTTYYPKTTFREFWKHNIKDGIWAILPMKYGAPPFKLRHLIPLIFVLSIISPLILSIWYRPFLYLTFGVLGFYLLASLYFSIHIALKERNPALIPYLVAVFAVRHFGYGIGSLIGLVKLIL
ncbi:MAG TPA: glycosyltransferase family 2 protein [Candidatus Paceibacterota bacterium]|nr:glycosyltransferase family 2 protein [Candidatus Paceibacterota bacterium]